MNNAAASTAVLHSSIEDYRARLSVAQCVILDLSIGLVGRVQSIEGTRDGSETLVTSEIAIIENKGKGWYSVRVISSDSGHGLFRTRRLVWGGEVVSA